MEEIKVSMVDGTLYLRGGQPATGFALTLLGWAPSPPTISTNSINPDIVRRTFQFGRHQVEVTSALGIVVVGPVTLYLPIATTEAIGRVLSGEWPIPTDGRAHSLPELALPITIADPAELPA